MIFGKIQDVVVLCTHLPSENNNRQAKETLFRKKNISLKLQRLKPFNTI